MIIVGGSLLVAIPKAQEKQWPKMECLLICWLYAWQSARVCVRLCEIPREPIGVRAASLRVCVEESRSSVASSECVSDDNDDVTVESTTHMKN